MADWIPKNTVAGPKTGSEHAGPTGTGLDLRESPPCGRLILRTRLPADEARSRVAKKAGIDLPIEPNTASGDEYAVLWIGPGRWLINVDLAELAPLRNRIATALAGSTQLLSDVSHARVVFSASGARAPELLSRLCPLDLDTRVFGSGQCAQTLLVRIPLLLHRVSDQPAYHLYVDRSLAHYAWDWLTDAAMASNVAQEAG